MPSVVLAAASAVVVAVALVGAVVVRRDRRQRHALATWGSARGLALVRRPSLPRATPFLRQPGVRVAHGVVGEIDGRPGGVYVARWNAANGVVRVRRTATILCVEGAIAGVPRLVLRPRIAGPASIKGIGDAMTGDRHVALESAAFARRFDLRVSADADDLALRRAFDPATVAALAAGDPFTLEVEGGFAVLPVAGIVSDPRALDALVGRIALPALCRRR